tara:strand:+ start:433 stop:786 length:354 start_codon:yes stop_codon:yes gene_type:complete
MMSDNMNDDIYNITYSTGSGTTYTIPTSNGLSATTITNTIPLMPNLGEDEDLHVEGDIKIDGHSLKDFMESVSDRLSILTPDPKLLEKYDALKEAYEHYKILEKLCKDDGKVHKETR